MKKLLAALAMFATLSGAQAAPIVVSFVPAATQIAVGDATTVDVVISGLDDEVLAAYDVDMLFDSSVLSNFFVTFYIAPWGGLDLVMYDLDFLPGRTQSTAYSLMDDDDELNDLQPNDFTLLTFGFTGLVDGFSLVNFGLDLDFERNFVGRNGESLDVSINGTCIAVGTGTCDRQVPEPTSHLLLGAAACAALWAGRRRKATPVAAH